MLSIFEYNVPFNVKIVGMQQLLNSLNINNSLTDDKVYEICEMSNDKIRDNISFETYCDDISKLIAKQSNN
jgi:hypothetical protein